ncbi:cysteine--1-D-myo-inosityl 2-amino-2-deoxy-alpha-D-glucopyranoside ligase [Nesterenkonia alkaliphila]|uniref:L-cysteine:1D-myo-inositol 2-amino-2-deoxy-alpha-D-glucopyranoside ligase n=1 Tax=Nesterenkonia alkaliphila TaxID=1463631 RepID=A0A7K1UM79_9MICC|nr:cysteine--1-D-myo-inosityl 2-amino-2-deoxy-alpha-D-glucopyranoside ligase [Nesterenkonia alkaliphila]MVT27588.1 cysteine--1-D-myo-inosityl 2-amino-2-deoxy-alpha-D-glucopyranoside ligase [Nesterenkonia alkaliphila]GFZ79853.1 L-cysteine:1D-myo-inositol 2-amino-2-deoxy-alpha-D-glucopyranoside ligase [Nesterenkonia alkaliphila]
MESWSSPAVPGLPPAPESLELYSTPNGSTLTTTARDGIASLYVCGITPYDATHLGHANTYVHFDLLVRYWRACGLQVQYVQNVTDIDDPLLERAAATGVDWQELAESQVQLFREDMEALQVIPPTEYLGAVEMIPAVVEDVERLLELGIAYPVPAEDAETEDYYFDIAAAQQRTDWQLGSIGGYDRAAMEELFPQRGGDPHRAGKRDPLDPLLWRAAREGEPQWPGGELGHGRPGWHIECSVIARRHLPAPFTVQGGGSDLRFPHHEFSAAHATAADGVPLAERYMHTGMVGLEGEKMSKSRGNLVLVSGLREQGVDPQAIRTLILSHHWREDWDYTETALQRAQDRLARWKHALTQAPEHDDAAAPEDLQYALMSALGHNLNAPAALDTLDMWASGQTAGSTGAARVRGVVLALLGLDLSAQGVCGA